MSIRAIRAGIIDIEVLPWDIHVRNWSSGSRVVAVPVPELQVGI